MIQFNIDEFFDTDSFQKTQELLEQLLQDRFYVTHTGIGYRTINHWDEKGLIRCSRNKEGGDRKFNFADFVWIKIVNELRTFGVPVPTVKKIADEVYTPLPVKDIFKVYESNPDLLKDFESEDREAILNFIKNKQYETIAPETIPIKYLHLLIADAIAGRAPSAIVVYKDGEWHPYNPSKREMYSEEINNRVKFSSHISICILDIIFQFLQSDTVIRFMKDFKLFTPIEQELMDVINSGAYDKITVHYKTKKYVPLAIKKSKDTKTKILGIIRDRQYHHFIITDLKGKENKLSA